VVIRNAGNGDLVIGTITSPSPPFSIETDSCSGQSLGGSNTCKVTYRFLPDSAGIFSAGSNIPSNGFSQDLVTVTLTGTGVGETQNYIHLLDPSDGETFTACTYYDPPTFQWEASEVFPHIEVQFSSKDDFSTILLKIKGSRNADQVTMTPNSWKRVLLLPGASGGTLYWRVVAKKKDKTIVSSDVFSLVVEVPGPVVNPEMSHTSKTALPPPTLSWDNSCNIISTTWFGNDSDFKNPGANKIAFSFKLKDSGGIQETFAKELTSAQWYSIRKLGGNVTGSILYWYVVSSDPLGRRNSTEIMSFVLTD